MAMITSTQVKSKSSQTAEVLQQICSRTLPIGVIGLGYVGLPLVKLFTEAGFPTVGFDIDDGKVAKLNRGQSYIGHIPHSDIEQIRATGRFRASADFTELSSLGAIIICVPTPLGEHAEPDLSFVRETAKSIRDNLQPQQLVILESTTYPGTVRSVVQPILEETGLRAGADFFLAYSPEREDPGNVTHTASCIPKVVGGIDAASLDVASALYEPLVPQIVRVSTVEVAEACKILENTYRAVNIALVNELKVLFERMDIDVWEVIEAAKTKPFGFQAFYPGPGLGGHCIPIDPFYLAWVAKQFDCPTRFIELAGEINTSMPEYVIQRMAKALNSRRKSINGSRIGVLGVAYKKDVDDSRESPSLVLIDRLQKLGAEVSYNDPHLSELPRTRKFPDLQVTGEELTPSYLASLDCVLIATDHSAYDFDEILKHAKLVVDTRGVTRGLTGIAQKVWSA